MFVDFNILNQLGSPAINSNTFANRPSAGQTGRLFVSTDTYELYRDNGTTWDLIGGPGSSTITGSGTATQVAFFSSTSALTSSANLFFDNTNNRLGVNTATPTVALDVVGKSLFTQTETYSSGNAIGVQVIENLTISSGTSVGLAAIGGVNSNLNLTLGGNATIANTGRQGLEGNSRLSFSSAGTLTMTQGSTIRAFSALSSVYSFNGSAIGTITHLAGYRICFPDNIGSAVNITNNYALLINDQTTGTGTVTYTNRWGIYQEGSSDLNYMAANLLLGSTTNSGEKLQVTGTSKFTGDLAVDTNVLFVDTTNDRVGIGTSDPSAKLVVSNGGVEGIELQPLQTTNTNRILNYNRSTGAYVDLRIDANAHQFLISGSERMRLDASGNLGLGTTTPDVFGRFYTKILGLTSSGSTAIEINGGSGGYAQIDLGAAGVRTAGLSASANETQWGSVTAIPAIIYTNSSERLRISSTGDVGIGTSAPVANTPLTLQAASGYTDLLWLKSVGTNIDSRINFAPTGTGITQLNNTTGTAIALQISGAEKMRLDASGNLGLGVTPSAWFSGLKAIQFGTAGVLWSNLDRANLAANLFIDALTNPFYINNGYALRYAQENGSHAWYNAPSGTAGNAISFTQAMTLFSTGNLAVGGTSDNGSRLNVTGAATFSSSITTAAPSGGTAKPYKWGEAGVAISGSNSQAVKVEIDGVLYYLMTATPA